MLHEYLLPTVGIALVAAGFSIMIRATGILPLERVVFAVGLVVAQAEISRPDSAADWVRPLLLWSLLALVVGFLLVGPYRGFRLARGGETTALVMSFALMNGLLVFAQRSSGGRSVPTRVSTLAVLLVLASVAVFVGSGSFLRWSGAGAAVRLARDCGDYLSSFGVSPRRVWLRTDVLSILLMCLGFATFAASQDNFSMGRFEKVLIPAFGIALASRTLNFFSILTLSLVMVISQKALFQLFGNAVLDRAYQSGVFVLVILLGLALSRPASSRPVRLLKRLLT